jgi:hypothetical protein
MVSASQQSNPLGAVIVFDGGNPKTFTAKVLSETLSGGALVHTSGTTNDVGSDIASYTSSDLLIVGAQDATRFNGITLLNAGSNEWTTVATRGAYLMRCAGIVSGGALVQHNASGNVLNWVGNTSGTSVIENTIVGRAMTTSASGTNAYALINLLG